MDMGSVYFLWLGVALLACLPSPVAVATPCETSASGSWASDAGAVSVLFVVSEGDCGAGGSGDGEERQQELTRAVQLAAYHANSCTNLNGQWLQLSKESSQVLKLNCWLNFPLFELFLECTDLGFVKWASSIHDPIAYDSFAPKAFL